MLHVPARPRRRGFALGLLGLTMLALAGCVGRPPEVSGEHASFLPRAAPGVAPGAAPKNVNGNSDTSGLGAGMLVSPNSDTTPTATPAAAK